MLFEDLTTLENHIIDLQQQLEEEREHRTRAFDCVTDISREVASFDRDGKTIQELRRSISDIVIKFDKATALKGRGIYLGETDKEREERYEKEHETGHQDSERDVS